MLQALKPRLQKATEPDKAQRATVRIAPPEFSRSESSTSGVPLFLQSSGAAVAESPRFPQQRENSLAAAPASIIQAKPEVGRPDDFYEKEADRVADSIVKSNRPRLNEDDDAGEVEPAPDLHDTVQGKYHNIHTGTPPTPRVENATGSGRNGHRMPLNVETPISSVLGADLSHVKVHDDDTAHKAAASMHARAFTHGHHIYLGAEQTPGDLGLMAHEAAHVVQQGAERPKFSPKENTLPSTPVTARTGVHTVQRKSTFQPVAAAAHQTVAQINAMSLSDFQEFTVRQLDWATSPHLTAPGAATNLAHFRQVLSFSHEPDILSTCGTLPVDDIIAAGIPAVFSHLRHYARGAASSRNTAWLRQTNSVTDAVNWGQALPGLEGACTPGTLQSIMPPPTPLSDPSAFENLVSAGRDADFINYVTTCDPILSATNGMEITSYLALRGEGADPTTYFGRIRYVRNFHRFERKALDGIVANEGVNAAGRWLRPLTLVLFSALDHNGAFHRLSGITELIVAPRILTIVLEGLGTLGDYESRVAPLAAQYGIGGRIDQVLIAGHGSPAGIELAGTATGGTVINESLEGGAAATHRTATENLIDELVNHMSTDPTQRRIVLYACLTASHEVDPTGIDPNNPATAAVQIQSAIRANPNIRDFIASRAGSGATVLGSQASQWATGFMTPDTFWAPPRLTLQAPHDPFIAAPKIQYVEFGPECGGAVRALVECWAVDQAMSPVGTTCRDAAQRRTKTPSTTNWDEQIVRGIYQVALSNYWSNGRIIARMVNVTDWLSHLEHDLDHPQGFDLWHNVGNQLPGGDIDTIFKALSPTTNWTSEARIRLIFNQAWMQHDASRVSGFTTALDTFTSCGDVLRYVDTWLVHPRITTILPALPPAAPPASQLIVAIMEAIGNPVALPLPATLPHHVEYLHRLLGTGTHFRDALNISGIASGFTTEEDILVAIGRNPRRSTSTATSGSASFGASLPAANVDLNRDATNMNDFYLEPFWRTGTVDHCSRLNVRARPWMSQRLDTIPRGHVVQIVGRHRNWYGIEHGGLIRFVYKDYITLIS
ncbi:DUF4157 domain-containing protein [Desulfatitalea alkaliphila]|uniref:DUF4157 domain-containing protein n=1 Tax=Desulfatitalea alkaliphila TaxID=2929485 RepID=A0AA41R2N3_9BACT|nr:DUF4157 domain-containing protein [Desulfatitalea alkaliphila]MCJ8500095.1 DUF4157 domain-containing protein [Desulfatitalea alkaliphila]